MKIRIKAATIIIILTILPLAFTFFITIPTTQTTQTQMILSHLSSVASIHESRVEEEIKDYHKEIAFLSDIWLPPFIDSYIENSSIDMQTLMYDELERMRNINIQIDHIEVVNSSGIILASSNLIRVGNDIGGEDYFIRALIGNVVDAFYLDANSSLKLHLAGPVILNGTVSAVAILDYDPSDLVTLFLDTTGLGEFGEALLAKRDENGDALFITSLRHREQASLNLTLPKDDLAAPITQALLGVEDTFTEAVDYRNVTVLAVTRFISSVDWGIVVKMDVSEAFGSMITSINIVMIASIVSAFVTLIAGFVIARSITEPIAKLTVAATKISEGELTQRADITSGDEIEVLAKSVNLMADTLVNSNIELEKRVERRTRELSRSNEALEQFAYVISHDLQEPLRMIVSYLQLIEDRYKDQLDDDARTFIEFAVDGSKRMREMIIDLLQFSRAGRHSQQEEEVDCNAILVEVLSNLQVSLQETGSNVDSKHLPTIIANRGGITALFQNLIANAIKYRSEKPLSLDINAVESGDVWQFSVADNGIGISEEYHQRIFDVFQKLHPRKEYPGTGIGLSVCKRVIESLGGRIWVESKLKEGSTFFFTIPKERIVK